MSLLENKQLKKAAGLLNSEAPDDHFLAYITAEERDMLVDAGGKKTATASGIMAYPPSDNYGGTHSSKSNENSASNQGSDRGHSRFDSGSGYYGGKPTSTTTTNNNEDNRQNYSATQTQTGVVPGGGEQIGYDKDGNAVFADTKVTPEVVRRQAIEYAEQFGGVAPLGSRPVTYSTKYAHKQMTHMAKNKLKTIKSKLTEAGFTDFDEDASLSEIKDYVDTLNRTGKIGDSWENSVDKDGNALYSPETIAKWKENNYVPQSLANVPVGFMGLGVRAFGAAPLTYDQLQNDFNTIEEIGQSKDMDWQDRMKKFSPKQWEAYSGEKYDPITQTYSTPRGEGGGSTRDRIERIEGAYNIGGTDPQESVAAQWYSGMNNTKSDFFFKNEYNDAKLKVKAVLGTPSAIGQVAVGNSVFFDFLKQNSLNKGIL